MEKILIDLGAFQKALHRLGYEARDITDILNAVQSAEIMEDKSKHPNYRKFTGAYNDFFKTCKTLMPKLTKADGRAINDMIDFLLLQEFVGNNYQKALEAWTLVLTNSEKLNNPFLKSQMLYPTSFRKYLPEIISKLRNLNNGKEQPTVQKRDKNLGKYA